MSKLSQRVHCCVYLCFVTLLGCCNVFGAALGSIRGVVHDPDHLPIADASVTRAIRHFGLQANNENGSCR